MDNRDWDTISIIQNSIVNNRLVESWDEKDSSLDYTSDDQSFHIICSFNPWQIVPEGSGKNIRIRLPIQEGLLTVDETANDISGISIIISCTLDFVNLPDNKKSSILTFDFSYVATSEKDGFTQGAVYPIVVEDKTDKLGIIKEQLLINGICDYLVENPNKVRYIFAQVGSLNEALAEWIRPVQNKYVFLDQDNGYFAICSVCDERDVSGYSIDIDVQNKDMYSTALFSINRDKVLWNIVLTSLLSTFENSTADFNLQDSVLLNNKTLNLHKIHNGAIDYYPKVKSFRGVITGEYLNITCSGNCNLYVGIDMTFSIEATIKPEKKNNNTIAFVIGDINVSKDSHVPWYWKFLLGLVDVAVNIISEDLINQISSAFQSSINVMEIDAIKWNDGNNETVLTNCFFSNELILQYKL
ncbi:TULIP family P47-like protein [Clostridium sp. CF012]|uniref:TULIP family P47-like protein n=1 Tax=Clostridium sp. CF012 TaxID=2843319 RepID=UPI001C0E14D5|nr:TULIP family P47-like protein [Clostridium sp. CF012]MBU3146262.1 TULIP family P47-like protein [Clostridium sp. CF012]